MSWKVRAVRVGPYRYDITQTTNFDADKTGECTPQRGQIRVQQDLSPDQTASTLLHEVLHACWDAAGLTSKTEEETIRRLEPWILGVLKDNPALVRFLVGGE